jgi:hypothetical protein
MRERRKGGWEKFLKRGLNNSNLKKIGPTKEDAQQL